MSVGTPGHVVGVNRWWQLVIGVICMAMVANLQYGWTLFVTPIGDKYGWSRAAIQVAFTIFVLTETWLVPIEGYLVDRFGPRWVVLGGGLLCGIGWVLNSYASSLAMLYFAAAVSGIGAGAVYGTCVGNALKWFPDKRGLAAGLTAAGFGAGSAMTIIPIAAMIKDQGYEAAFLFFGIIQGVTVMVVSIWLKAAPLNLGKILNVVSKVQQSARNYTPKEVLRNPTFWVLYFMFVMVAAGGLMATAQIGPIAKDFKLGSIPVSMMGITLPALTFALTIDRVLNGVTRPFFGWVSDKIGREQTMFICFALETVGILALYKWGHQPVAFVLLTGLVFFAWGEIYSLFPSTCTDTFGSKFATTNAGLLYTAKGTASLVVPLASVLVAATGNWSAVFYLAAGMNAIAALMAWFVLRPMRKAEMSKSS
ncbi:MAG: oxalate/formate MFS antiporter [Polaromonas sp.]|nr:oxalate/formate MFS antiporter [Polaromonas sp.]